MNEDILNVVDAVSNEKGVSKEIIFEAIEAALESATRKLHRDEVDVRVAIDRGTGDYSTFRRWQVVPDDMVPLELPEQQLRLGEARVRQPEVQLEEFIEEPMKSVEFGRIGAQNARQVIIQKVREAERARVVEIYKDRVGEMVSGTVKSLERNGGVVLDLGDNAEGYIPRGELIPRESVRLGDRMRCILLEVRQESRTPQLLLLSRTDRRLLIELFRIEVPEINEGIIRIVAGARDPGKRARLAVQALDPRTDPIGACVGMRGSRVQNVSNELAGERVDIIAWDKEPARYVLNAMVPNDIVSVVVDWDAKSMDLVVQEDKQSQAIGTGGQNVKLASILLGWELNVIPVEVYEERHKVEAEELRKIFQEELNTGEDVAGILVDEGYTSIEEIAYVPESELLQIEAYNQELVEKLRERAKDVLLNRELKRELRLLDAKPAQDLLDMEGMDRELAFQLASHGISTMADLAAQSVDEMVDDLQVEGVDPQRAGELIMQARQPWLEEEEQAAEEQQGVG